MKSRLVALLAMFTLFVTPGAYADTPEAAIAGLLKLDQPPTESPFIHVERNGGAVRGVIAEVVPLEVDHVLNEVLLCYGAFPDWFPLQTAARYVSPVENNSGVIYGALSFPWPIGSRDFEADISGRFEESADTKLYRIDFAHRTGTGNVAKMEGNWLLQPFGDKTLVIYDATIDFDTWVPGFLMAAGTKQFLPAIMEGISARTAKCPAQHRAIK